MLSWAVYAPRNARSPTSLTPAGQGTPRCPAGLVQATKLPRFSRG